MPFSVFTRRKPKAKSERRCSSSDSLSIRSSDTSSVQSFFHQLEDVSGLESCRSFSRQSSISSRECLVSFLASFSSIAFAMTCCGHLPSGLNYIWASCSWNARTGLVPFTEPVNFCDSTKGPEFRPISTPLSVKLSHGLAAVGLQSQSCKFSLPDTKPCLRVTMLLVFKPEIETNKLF